MKTTSASIAVRNLCAPTLPCYPPAQDRFHWRVLSHLGSSFLSLMDNAEVLRGTLALYEWTDSEMNRRRLEAILDVKHRATERFAQGHLVRGVQIEVTLDSHGFCRTWRYMPVWPRCLAASSRSTPTSTCSTA
ncbi:protein ImpG/VasA [Klebsiella pneumoniae]|uniref:Protein ImpG/VasA n=1 Tax=Klebsiella pneumoniae TaxID=573 RepID=A0A4P0Y4F1_KLEPN|nr:protein ImpG/VasA [Klebsiella pneumoniae]